jgi:hypothetical protein
MEEYRYDVSRIVPKRKINAKGSTSRDESNTAGKSLGEKVMTPYDIADDIRFRQAVALSGKFSKQALARLEAQGLLTKEIRKVILDAFGDYRRELEEMLLDA